MMNVLVVGIIYHIDDLTFSSTNYVNITADTSDGAVVDVACQSIEVLRL